MDWPRIVLGSFKHSKIYKNVEPYFLENPDIDTLIGHSAGGSAVLELQKNHEDRQITPITYNAPVFERGSSDPMAWVTDDNKPLRFSTAWDPVSMLDYNSRVTYKAPDVNLDFARNAMNTYNNPNLENIKNSIQNGFKPILEQHSMTGTYSNPSTVKDFIESGVKTIAAINTATVL